jgi:hypothetical protein
MTQPIYKMYYLRQKEAWFQLTKEEQDQLLGKVEETLKQVGGKTIVFCDSGWASEKWWYWGVEEYPSLEAVQEHARLLTELNWMRYCDSEILLGTAMTL